jgi:hypothetical protein
MKYTTLSAVSLSILMAVMFVIPVVSIQEVNHAGASESGVNHWGLSETFWNVSTGTHAPATFNDITLVQQTSTDSVVLDGWLWEMTKANMVGTVARFSPSGPATRTNDWNISAEITRPREDSAYTPYNKSVAAGNQSLIIYLTNETGFVLAGLNMTTGSVYGESIGAYDAFNTIWSQVADDVRPAFPNDFESYGYKPDRYVVSFSHESLSSAVEIVVRNTATGVVFKGSYSIPTLEGADNPQLRFDIRSTVGTVSTYNVAGGWIIDNLMFKSMRSRYPTIGPDYEKVAKQDPIWLDVKDIDGNPIIDADVSINGTSASYNGAFERYEAILTLPVDWDVPIPFSALVDGMLVNDTLKVSTTPDPDNRVSLPRWWNGWDWATVLGRDDSSTPLSAQQTYSAFYHPKTSYINTGFTGNSTDVLATQSEIAIHFPHDYALWGHKFWVESVASAETGHSAFESAYWFASRWDDPRYVGKGDSYISIANPGNSGSWEQMFAEYARGTRVMGISSQYYLAGNSSLIGSYWLYGPTNSEIPSWGSWHPNTKLDMMDMFRGLNTDFTVTSLNEWATAFSIAQAAGVFRIYNHGAIADPGFLRWICDNKTNMSYENWKATDGEAASYVYGSGSTDIVYNSSSTRNTWMYDVSRRSPYAAGYWNVPVTVAINVTDKNVSDVEIVSGTWDLKMSDGSLRDLKGNRTMDVGFDIRGNTLYVSYFWNASSSLRVSVQSLTNPRPINLPETSALAWDNYSCTILSTPPDNGTTTWTLAEAPSWLSIETYNDTACVLKGFPKASGVYQVSLMISDLNSTEYLDWTITVVRLKFVDGYVRDSGANPLPNVTVMVTFRDSLDNIRWTKYADNTTASGYYSVTFLESDWSPGDKIEVSAFYDNATALNVTTASDYPYQEVDLMFAAEVPEFGTVFGAVGVAASFALMACFIIRRRRG